MSDQPRVSCCDEPTPERLLEGIAQFIHASPRARPWKTTDLNRLGGVLGAFEFLRFAALIAERSDLAVGPRRLGRWLG